MHGWSWLADDTSQATWTVTGDSLRLRGRRQMTDLQPVIVAADNHAELATSDSGILEALRSQEDHLLEFGVDLPAGIETPIMHIMSGWKRVHLRNLQMHPLLWLHEEQHAQIDELRQEHIDLYWSRGPRPANTSATSSSSGTR